MELIKFNLFDNSGTFAEFVQGRAGVPGAALKSWRAMRLPKDAKQYAAVGGDGPQLCQGELIRFRNLDGICNDLRNPLLASTGMPFARNVQFEATYPDLGRNELARQSPRRAPEPARARPAGHQPQALHAQPVAARQVPRRHGPAGDRIDKGLIAQDGAPPEFTAGGKPQLARAYKTHTNKVTGGWDASQLYSYDETSRQRVKRDPADPAKLLLRPGPHAGVDELLGYLPVFGPGDPISAQWAGQEATAFPDNWSIGLSFHHTVFAREHNAFVTAFRAQTKSTPEADSGLRNPVRADAVIRYQDLSDDELFEVTRLVVAAEIAKIHTIEWTPQLLCDEPLYLGMNANWSGLLAGHELAAAALEKIAVQNFGTSDNAKKATPWYSALASGPGIFGLGSHVYADDTVFAKTDPNEQDVWSLNNPDHVNVGINHFGSPFNFPEEFVSVYRPHALVPDLIEAREWELDANVIRHKMRWSRPSAPRPRPRCATQARPTGRCRWAASGSVC